MNSNKVSLFREKVQKKLFEFNLVRKRYRIECQELKKAEERLEATQAALEIIQVIAQQIQQQAHNQIAGVVSRCLEAVFDEPYEFKIHFVRKRGRTEARLIFERDGYELDPMTASGGGVIDISSFALRLSRLLLSRPKARKFLAMDEPFKYVSEEYRGRVRDLLSTLSTEMQVQFVMVTHINELKIGKVVHL